MENGTTAAPRPNNHHSHARTEMAVSPGTARADDDLPRRPRAPTTRNLLRDLPDELRAHIELTANASWLVETNRLVLQLPHQDLGRLGYHTGHCPLDVVMGHVEDFVETLERGAGDRVVESWEGAERRLREVTGGSVTLARFWRHVSRLTALDLAVPDHRDTRALLRRVDDRGIVDAYEQATRCRRLFRRCAMDAAFEARLATADRADAQRLAEGAVLFVSGRHDPFEHVLSSRDFAIPYSWRFDRVSCCGSPGSALWHRHIIERFANDTEEMERVD